MAERDKYNEYAELRSLVSVLGSSDAQIAADNYFLVEFIRNEQLDPK